MTEKPTMYVGNPDILFSHRIIKNVDSACLLNSLGLFM